MGSLGLVTDPAAGPHKIITLCHGAKQHSRGHFPGFESLWGMDLSLLGLLKGYPIKAE